MLQAVSRDRTPDILANKTALYYMQINRKHQKSYAEIKVGIHWSILIINY